MQRLGQPGSREACRRILNRSQVFPSIRPSLAGLRSWLRAEMTLLTGTGIHFWIAIAFLTVLVFHLFLHWRWIATLMRGRPREGSGARVALRTVGLTALLALAIAPAQPQVLAILRKSGG